MINVLFVIDHILNVNGGTEGQLFMLLSNLDQNLYRPHLFCLKDTGWARTARLDFPLKVLNVHRLLGLHALGKLLEVRNYCRENKIHIVQTYFNDALIFGAVAGRLAGVKTIIACRRNLGPGFWGNRRLLSAFRAVKRLNLYYMANSQATKESIVKFEGIDPGRIDVIYNGLDMNRFCAINEGLRQRTRKALYINDSHVLIGMVAHLRPEKNLLLFARAAKAIGEKYPQARFVVFGEGKYREELQKEIDTLGVQDILKLAGARLDIVPYLAAMDIACLTSDGESFSNAIIEYQAAGLPVVATAVGGNIEALSSNGFLFPPGDLDGFVELLSKLIDNGELRRQTGNAGRAEAARKYSVKSMVAGHEEMYRKRLGGIRREA